MRRKSNMQNKRYVKYPEYCSLVSSICRDITLSQWVPDYIVGITRGGLLPATMISHYFTVPCRTLDVSLSSSDNLESNLWMAEDAIGYLSEQERELHKSRWDPSFKKNILIVDDINDTGSTINWILKDWPSGCLPNADVWKTVWNNNVRFAVLFDNLHSKCNITMDYAGEELDKQESDWVVFPYEEWWK